MRLTWLVFIAVLTLTIAACSEGATPAAPAGDIPQYTIRGTVSDSLGGLIGLGGLPGVEVRVNGRPLSADAQSRWSRVADSGLVRIEVADNRFERYQRTVLLDRNMEVAVLLRRLAPAIVGFSSVGDSITARVVDLQGRKTVERWDESHVDIDMGGATLTVIGRQLHWHPIDNWTYQMVLPSVPDGAVSLDWTVEDDQGFSFREVCQLAIGCRGVPLPGN